MWLKELCILLIVKSVPIVAIFAQVQLVQAARVMVQSFSFCKEFTIVSHAPLVFIYNKFAVFGFQLVFLLVAERGESDSDVQAVAIVELVLVSEYQVFRR